MNGRQVPLYTLKLPYLLRITNKMATLLVQICQNQRIASLAKAIKGSANHKAMQSAMLRLNQPYFQLQDKITIRPFFKYLLSCTKSLQGMSLKRLDAKFHGPQQLLKLKPLSCRYEVHNSVGLCALVEVYECNGVS